MEDKVVMEEDLPSFPFKSSSNALLSVQLLEFKTSLLEAVEELRIGRDAKTQYEEHIAKIMMEKQELEWQNESLGQQSETLMKQHSESISTLKKQLQAKIYAMEEEKGKYQLAAETKEKEIIGLKEDLKALQISKYTLEKKLCEMEQKVQLHILAKDDNLKQLSEVEKCYATFTRQFGIVKAVQEKLEPNVQEAIQHNHKLSIMNKQRENEIYKLKQDLEKVTADLIRSKVQCQKRQGEESMNLIEKEQQLQALQQKLQMEIEINRRLNEEHIKINEEKQEIIRSLQNVQELHQQQTDITARLESQFLALQTDYQILERDNELQREKVKETEEKFLHLQNERERAIGTWKKDEEILKEHIDSIKSDLISIKEAYDDLQESHSKLSSQRLQDIDQVKQKQDIPGQHKMHGIENKQKDNACSSAETSARSIGGEDIKGQNVKDLTQPQADPKIEVIAKHYVIAEELQVLENGSTDMKDASRFCQKLYQEILQTPAAQACFTNTCDHTVQLPEDNCNDTANLELTGKVNLDKNNVSVALEARCTLGVTPTLPAESGDMRPGSIEGSGVCCEDADYDGGELKIPCILGFPTPLAEPVKESLAGIVLLDACNADVGYDVVEQKASGNTNLTSGLQGAPVKLPPDKLILPANAECEVIDMKTPCIPDLQKTFTGQPSKTPSDSVSPPCVCSTSEKYNPLKMNATSSSGLLTTLPGESGKIAPDSTDAEYDLVEPKVSSCPVLPIICLAEPGQRPQKSIRPSRFSITNAGQVQADPLKHAPDNATIEVLDSKNKLISTTQSDKEPPNQESGLVPSIQETHIHSNMSHRTYVEDESNSDNHFQNFPESLHYIHSCLDHNHNKQCKTDHAYLVNETEFSICEEICNSQNPSNASEHHPTTVSSHVVFNDALESSKGTAMENNIIYTAPLCHELSSTIMTIDYSHLKKSDITTHLHDVLNDTTGQSRSVVIENEAILKVTDDENSAKLAYKENTCTSQDAGLLLPDMAEIGSTVNTSIELITLTQNVFSANDCQLSNQKHEELIAGDYNSMNSDLVNTRKETENTGLSLFQGGVCLTEPLNELCPLKVKSSENLINAREKSGTECLTSIRKLETIPPYFHFSDLIPQSKVNRIKGPTVSPLTSSMPLFLREKLSHPSECKRTCSWNLPKSKNNEEVWPDSSKVKSVAGTVNTPGFQQGQRRDHSQEWNAIAQTFSDSFLLIESAKLVSTGKTDTTATVTSVCGPDIDRISNPIPDTVYSSSSRTKTSHSPETLFDEDAESPPSSIQNQIKEIETFLSTQRLKRTKKRKLEETQASSSDDF